MNIDETTLRWAIANKYVEHETRRYSKTLQLRRKGFRNIHTFHSALLLLPIFQVRRESVPHILPFLIPVHCANCRKHFFQLIFECTPLVKNRNKIRLPVLIVHKDAGPLQSFFLRGLERHEFSTSLLSVHGHVVQRLAKCDPSLGEQLSDSLTGCSPVPGRLLVSSTSSFAGRVFLLEHLLKSLPQVAKLLVTRLLSQCGVHKLEPLRGQPQLLGCPSSPKVRFDVGWI
mmetsp:Transcript_24384/g.64146  ORF Transcript_24384/g.64146 Transcript_24384/m.64146 type:complete len:229 (-) Transcript_24384:484-1170(-)